MDYTWNIATIIDYFAMVTHANVTDHIVTVTDSFSKVTDHVVMEIVRSQKRVKESSIDFLNVCARVIGPLH